MKRKLSGANIQKIVEEVAGLSKQREAGRKGEVERLKAELKKIESKVRNLMEALEEGLRPQEIRERLAELGQRKEALMRDIREVEKNNELDSALEGESLRMALLTISDILDAIREAPEELRELLKHYLKIEFDTEKKRGSITFFLPLNGENPVNIATSSEDGCLTNNRSGQMRSETTQLIWRIVMKRAA